MVDKKKAVKKVVEKAEVKPTFTFELPSLTELLESGAHFGHSVKRRNPRMDKYVYAIKNGVQVLDLVKTRQLLQEACEYLSQKATEGPVLVLGTKAQAVEAIREGATKIGAPYIVNRWVGGLFTNWNEVKKRVDKLSDMRAKMESGDYKKYTKKEQVLLSREIERLDRLFGGVVSLKELPKAIFIVDPTRESTAVREARAMKIPIVAIIDTNCDPREMASVIPANDDSQKTVTMLVNSVMGAIGMGMKKEKKTT